MKMTHKPPWIPAFTGMTEEGHLSFYFHGDKQSFLRKQESIYYNFHSWGWAKLPIRIYNGVISEKKNFYLVRK